MARIKSVIILLPSFYVLLLCAHGFHYVAEGIRVMMKSMMEMEDWRASSSWASPWSPQWRDWEPLYCDDRHVASICSLGLTLLHLLSRISQYQTLTNVLPIPLYPKWQSCCMQSLLHLHSRISQYQSLTNVLPIPLHCKWQSCRTQSLLNLLSRISQHHCPTNVLSILLHCKLQYDVEGWYSIFSQGLANINVPSKSFQILIGGTLM